MIFCHFQFITFFYKVISSLWLSLGRFHLRTQRAIFLRYDHTKHVFSMHFDTKSNIMQPTMSHNHVQLSPLLVYTGTRHI